MERLTRQADLPMPEVGIYESPEVNAFATGPSKSRSLVAVSSGLLRGMRQNEVEGVLAHEVAHIANGDMVTMTLVQGVMNAFVMFLARLIASFLRGSSRDNTRGYAMNYMVVIVLEIVLGILGSMVTAWFSRQREFRADYGGATLAGRGNMLAALQRLAANQQLIDPRHEALATMKISGSAEELHDAVLHAPAARAAHRGAAAGDAAVSLLARASRRAAIEGILS